MCTASPRSRWSAAGTGPAMKSPLERNKPFAPSKPTRRWGTASSSRPSLAPGHRAASGSISSLCQRSTRGQDLSGPLNQCSDQFPKAGRGECTRMAKVEDEKIISLTWFLQLLVSYIYYLNFIVTLASSLKAYKSNQKRFQTNVTVFIVILMPLWASQ